MYNDDDEHELDLRSSDEQNEIELSINSETRSEATETTPQQVLQNRSVYNLIIYENDEDDLTNISHSSRSYLEEDDLPLPVISDSESSRWSRFGQCCDCCDACLRKRKWISKCKCTKMKIVFYYIIINCFMLLFFCTAVYMTQVNFYQNPANPPFKQLKFKEPQYPGLTMVPSMVNLDHCPLSLIYYGSKGEDSFENRRETPYVKRIATMLTDYSKKCDSSLQCNLRQETLGPCKAPDFGYKAKTPCIFLKLNRLTLWLPEQYTLHADIPDDLPSELRPKIKLKASRLWVNCKGETLYDQEKIGKVDYYPRPYFNSTSFPLTNFKDTNPIIAIRLTRIKRHIVKLVCGMYAKNVHMHKAQHVYIYIRN
ncbi:sodium/potassium-transporting ATPase subunit beta-like isoform X2 [Atheta coriaria]|uniref:sodium/potassium-transporting ATPase subunit beta-like isoform X2 n=1 Tax=Dalotia coriaria TaxID=877792 RepID=UPI0031F4179E